MRNLQMGITQVIFSQNTERRHRTAVYVLVVTEEMPEWEDSIKIGKAGFSMQIIA